MSVNQCPTIKIAIPTKLVLASHQDDPCPYNWLKPFEFAEDLPEIFFAGMYE